MTGSGHCICYFGHDAQVRKAPVQNVQVLQVDMPRVMCDAIHDMQAFPNVTFTTPSRDSMHATEHIQYMPYTL